MEMVGLLTTCSSYLHFVRQFHVGHIVLIKQLLALSICAMRVNISARNKQI